MKKLLPFHASVVTAIATLDPAKAGDVGGATMLCGLLQTTIIPPEHRGGVIDALDRKTAELRAVADDHAAGMIQALDDARAAILEQTRTGNGAPTGDQVDPALAAQRANGAGDRGQAQHFQGNDPADHQRQQA